MNIEEQYLGWLEALVYKAKHRGAEADRTGTGRHRVFAQTLRHDMNEGFPLFVSKYVHWKSVIEELVWFVNGKCDNVKPLQEKGVRIWNEWADEDGHLGGIYGMQWRRWKHDEMGKDYTDQLAEVIYNLIHNPTSTRHIVTAWNVSELDSMALPPCHMTFQFFVDTHTNELSLFLHQRSGDVFLGVPFNIASYSALLHFVAAITGYKPKRFACTIGDLHLYANHVEAAGRQMAERGRIDEVPLPTLKIADKYQKAALCGDVEYIGQLLDNLTSDAFILEGYDAGPKIKAPISV